MALKYFIFLPLVCSLFVTTYSQAAESGSFYFGMNVSGRRSDVNFSYPALSERAYSYNAGMELLGGVNIGRHLSVEGGGSCYGSDASISGGSHVCYLSGNVVTHYPVSTDADVYAKVGVVSDQTQDEQAMSAGTGVYYKLTESWWMDVGYRWVGKLPTIGGRTYESYELTLGIRYQPPVVVPEPSKPAKSSEPVHLYSNNIITLFEDADSGEPLFGANSAVLSPTPELRALAQTLLEHDEGSVHITSYLVKDESKQGEAPSRTLSKERANAVADYFTTRGINRERLVIKWDEPLPFDDERNVRQDLNRSVDIDFYPQDERKP